jgi:hypothetical protein
MKGKQGVISSVLLKNKEGECFSNLAIKRIGVKATPQFFNPINQK